MNAKTRERYEKYTGRYIEAGNRLFYAAQAANTSSSGFSVNPFAFTDEAAQTVIETARQLLEEKRKRLEELESAIGEYDMAIQNQGPDLYRQKMINEL
jgi:hypothetical protein